MRVFLLFLFSFFGVHLFAQSINPSSLTISDSLRKVIQAAVSARILSYRVDNIPEIKYEDKVFVLVGDTLRRAPEMVLLGAESWMTLLLDIQPWPSEYPWPNYYLLTKKSNRFIVDAFPKDTLTFKAYDQYNKYFPDDDRFLVYYDAQKEHLINLSGNFRQGAIYSSWFKGSYIYIPQMRLAQYSATRPYDIIQDKDTSYYLMERCNLIKNYPGKFIIKTAMPPKLDFWEIIYYSNKEAITGDSNNQHFYEVKYIRKFFFGDPKPVTSSKPLLRLIDIPERDALEKLYRTIPYVFGDIDMSAFK
jgi:hypothetical protein